jgi:CrcB protein
MAYVLVAVGGAIGSVARYGVGEWVASVLGTAFPWGTLIVNIVGSFIIGAVAALAGSDAPAITDNARLFLAVGVCGGFTTFSAFSLQTLALIQAGAWPQAVLNIAGSVVLCLIAVWVGTLAASTIR